MHWHFLYLFRLLNNSSMNRDLKQKIGSGTFIIYSRLPRGRDSSHRGRDTSAWIEYSGFDPGGWFYDWIRILIIHLGILYGKTLYLRGIFFFWIFDPSRKFLIFFAKFQFARKFSLLSPVKWYHYFFKMWKNNLFFGYLTWDEN